MSPDPMNGQINALREDLRDLRQEMNANFTRLEERLRALEIERGRLLGVAGTIGAILGAFSGWLVELMRGGR